MNAKMLEEQIELKIKEGRSFQEVYDALNAAYPSREIDIAKLVSEVPSLAQRQRFALAHRALMVALGLLILVQLFNAVMVGQQSGVWTLIAAAIPAIVYILFFTGIFHWKPMYFKSAGYLSFFLLTVSGERYPEGIVSQYIWLDMALYAAVGFLGVLTGHQLGGKYKTASQQYTDGKGQIRARHTIRFEA
jgi:hypothetical protein